MVFLDTVVPSFIGLRKRMRCNLPLYLSSLKNRVIALVKYLDIYRRDFGISWFNDMSVYDCTRGDRTIRTQYGTVP